MALINEILEPRAYEPIRERIGAILTLELTNQAAITYDDDLLVNVYNERSKPVQPNECPVVNVSLAKSDYDNQTVIKSDGTYQFLIDCYCTSATTDDERGDSLASFKSQRLAGVCMAILEHPVYLTLGFTPPFIIRSQVTGFEVGEPDRSESTNMTLTRITLSVKSSQNEPTETGVELALSLTQVKLGLTEKGYLFSTDATFDPFPPNRLCAPVTITDSDGTTVVEVDAGNSFTCAPVVPFEPVTGQNSDNTFSFTADNGENVPLPDIEITTADGVLTYPSVVDVDLSSYREIILPTGTRTPVNSVSNPNTQIAWIGLVNTSTGNGSVEKTGGGAAWNADANFVIPTLGDFSLSFTVLGFAMVGFSIYDINASFDTLGFALYRFSGGYIVYESGAVQYNGADATNHPMRIDFIGSDVKYYVNNVLVRTSTIPAATFTHGYLTFDCSILNVGDKIENILLTFL